MSVVLPWVQACTEAEEAMGALVLSKPIPPNSVPHSQPLPSPHSTFNPPCWCFDTESILVHLHDIFEGRVKRTWLDFPFLACAFPINTSQHTYLSIMSNAQKGAAVLLSNYWGPIESSLFEPWVTHVWFYKNKAHKNKLYEPKGISLADFRWTRGKGRKIAYLALSSDKPCFVPGPRSVLAPVSFTIPPYQCKFDVGAILAEAARCSDLPASEVEWLQVFLTGAQTGYRGSGEFLRDYSRFDPTKPEHVRVMWDERGRARPLRRAIRSYSLS